MSSASGPSKLRLIGHGTTGTDGIEAGIHLRWSFPEKLGYPANGIRLYRRQSPKKIIICTPDLPATLDVTPDGLTGLPPGPWPATFHFVVPCPADRIEIKMVFQPDSDFYVVLRAGAEVYDAVHFTDRREGDHSLVFVDEGITAVTIVGSGIVVKEICYYCCESMAWADWVEITPDYAGKPPVGLSAGELANYYKVKDQDYAVALARLFAASSERPMGKTEFNELKAVLEQVVFEDGVSVPVNWSRPNGVEDSGDPDQGIPEVDMSSHDLLRLSSLERPLAQVLGTYFLDLNVTPGPIYDYRLEVDYPPDHLADLACKLTFKDYEPVDPLYSDFAVGDVMFKNLYQPEILLRNSVLGRVDRGLRYENGPVADAGIVFSGDVREVQLLVGFRGTLEVEARLRRDPAQVFRFSSTHSGPEAIVKISGEWIEEIRLTGQGMVLFRVHYDEEKLSDITLKARVCGLRVEKAVKLMAPEGLAAMALPAVPTYDADKLPQAKYLAGLRWRLDRNPGKRQLPQAPVAFHIYRRRVPGPFEQVTLEGPAYIVYPDDAVYDPPEGWPELRPFFLDGLGELGNYQYEITAQDLFGRVSSPSNRAMARIVSPVPPAPVQVHARYLDAATLRKDGTSSDPNLNRKDLDWLVQNRTNAIRVNWSWTEGQAGFCADVATFQVHFQPDWLNLFRGEIVSDPVAEGLAAADVSLAAWALDQYPDLEGQSAFKTYRFSASLAAAISEDGFAMSWLKQGRESFLVLKNTAGVSPEIWVLMPPALAGGEPERQDRFVITLQPRSKAFVNYREAANWTDTSVTARVAFADFESDRDGVKTFRTYLVDPAFPAPAFVADEQHPMRFAQMGVSAINGDGVQGAVSAPAAIMAVHRQPPGALDPSFVDYGTAKATPANVHGKSTFYYRWQKQHGGLKYFVYRTMDKTLFRVDLAQGRPAPAYHALADNFGIAYDPGTFRFNSLDDYDRLDTNQIFVVANMSGNEAAFTRLNDQAVDEKDDRYQNRNTTTPGIGEADPTVNMNFLLFADGTLDGRGQNLYFYRIRTVDVAGNLGDWSETTIPVTLPRVTPPVSPAIASITGGHNQVTLNWEHKTETAVLGYNVYRTEDPVKAGDWRRMGLLKINAGDSVSVDAGSFSFTDKTVLARVSYYYGIVAVMEDDDGHALLGRMSPVRTARAWDDAKPEILEPEMRHVVDYEADTIALLWSTTESDYACELSRTPEWPDGDSRAMTYDPARGGFTFLDTGVDLGIVHQYRLTVRTANGQEADIPVLAEVIP